MTTMLYTNFSAFVSNEKYANILEHTDTVLFCISLVLTPVTIIVQKTPLSIYSIILKIKKLNDN
jgi:hypothetical protein